MRRYSSIVRRGLATVAAAALGVGVYAGLNLGIWSGGSAAAQTVTCDTATTPFCNSLVPLPHNWMGRVFKLNQAYPAAAPADAQPWLAFDPKTQQAQYIAAVLTYFYQGNTRPSVEDSFDPTQNTVRQWYNAPWQDFGLNGREPIHGLTRERVSKPHELDPHQASSWNNYAVGFYNAPGGVTIGKVWANHGSPNAALASMPEGTVAAKLLFTTASVTEVPYLQGAPTWNAYVTADPHNGSPKKATPRAVLPVRLLQIDVAVKDSRVANLTGWVFGTFVYGGGPGGPAGSGWTNVAPVGLMWGNDPGHTGASPLTQTWLNPAVHMPHVGFQGRLNGPVDNKASSCLSCHSTAETPAGVMIPPNGPAGAPWFRNIPSGTPFDAGRQSMDYSLQLAVGLTNFKTTGAIHAAPNHAALTALMKRVDAASARPARDGGRH